jgi:Na+-translocating ferredoxin:NAD+ oxidoreductase subunit B
MTASPHMNGIGAAAIDALLPQTQCMRCGFAGCLPYAEALAAGTAELNRCPPGGARLIDELAALLQRPPLPLDPACGTETPARVAEIVIADCIGCARCLPACPVDAIIGARRRLHTVLADWCTGCELCLPACPVDCIRMPERAHSGPSASAPAPGASRERFRQHQQRLRSSAAERARLLAERKRAAGAAAGSENP